MQRLVIKVGTNVLTTERGELDRTVIWELVDQISVLKKQGIEVILVSSGAVAAGKTLVQLSKQKEREVSRQIYSAVGQPKLMNIYTEYFSSHNIVCAQVLATREDFSSTMENYKNMKNCLYGLLEEGIIPIVNENDVVSLDELMFTDNDEMAGLMAFMVEADALYILSNIDGVFDGPPSDDDSSVISEVPYGDESFDKFIQTGKSSGGRGGMQSKFDVAKRLTEKGIPLHIVNGKREKVILELSKGKDLGTVFLADS